MTEENRYRGWRFLYSPRWLGYYAMLVIFAVACVLLSEWQFDRRDEKRAEIALVTQNYDAAPVPLSDVISNPADFDESSHKWQPVTLTGEYVSEPILVRNRPGPTGRSGSNLVQAFRTDSDEILFIDRGWVDVQVGDAAYDRGMVTATAAPIDAPLSVTVRVRASEEKISGREPSANSVGSINTKDLASVASLPHDATLITGAYGMLAEETVTGADSPKHGELPARPANDEGLHFSYALQWLVFILIAGIGVTYAARQEFKNFNRGSDRLAQQEERAAARQARRKKRFGPSDADEEDALLDQ